MSYNATHRRNLSVPGPKTSLDPNPTPTPSSGSATIQEISTHFSRLYLNHKARSFLTPSSHPPSESTTASTDASLTKSQSQRTRRKPLYVNEEPQEESIKQAIIISSKEPTNNVNSVPEKGEVRRLQEGYEVRGQSLALIGMDRGRRWTFGCRSQVEMVDFLAFNGVKVVSADMPPLMQIHAVEVTRKTHDSLEKFSAKTLASTLKKEFDGVYGPAWHCIVGLSFGSFVTHSVGGFLYFSMDQKLYVLLFKTTVPRAR